MPDYTNELNTLKARRRASTATAIVLFVLGLLLAGIGGFAAAGSALSEHYKEANSWGVLFWIGCPLLVIGIILFIKTAGITSEINELERRSTPETASNKDKMPAHGEKRRGQ